MNRVHSGRAGMIMVAVAGVAMVCGPAWGQGGGGAAGTPAATPAPTAARPVASVAEVRSLLQAALPGDAQEVATVAAAVREGQIKPGTALTVRGYIPSGEGGLDGKVAVFALNADGGSGPAVARVRVLGKGGEPLGGSLAGQHGLRAGAEVFVSGVVAAGSGAEAGLVIDVAALHVPRGGLPAGVLVSESPAGAVDVSAFREAGAKAGEGGEGAIKPGQKVVVRGRVGGSAKPFAEGRAVMTLVGRAIKPCNEKADDGCTTPWDYCCDPRPTITANSVTVQVVDGRGQPLRTDLRGRKGLKELTEVTVSGTVARVEGGSVVITAERMWW